MKHMSAQSKVSLNESVSIPCVGLGVWKIAQGEETEVAVTQALQAGYRLIDTAKYYGNEASVGRSVNRFVKSGEAGRQDISVTTKLWPSDFRDPERAFMQSLSLLGLEYIDLYLIHWPDSMPPRVVWQVLERMHEQKLARAIGISNFETSDIESLMSYANIPPAVNQIKLSVFDHDLRLLNHCKENNIVVEAYSPLERGRVDHPVIQHIAAAHSKTPAQIMLRWCIEHGVIPLPKSSHPDRQRENIDIFDFELSPEEMITLDALG
jgi:methylglyoxal/glyoxal reductase